MGWVNHYLKSNKINNSFINHQTGGISDWIDYIDGVNSSLSKRISLKEEKKAHTVNGSSALVINVSIKRSNAVTHVLS